MKIGSVNSIIGQYSKIQTEIVPAQPKVKPSFDEVELSPEGRLFTEAFALTRSKMTSAEGADDARLERIMEQMRAGDYRVEIRDICDKLLFA